MRLRVARGDPIPLVEPYQVTRAAGYKRYGPRPGRLRSL
jgi:hypothetical protein